MEPDREDRSAGHAGLREAWRRRSLATGWLTADDWHSEAVEAVLAACCGDRPAPGRPVPGSPLAPGRPVPGRALAPGSLAMAGGDSLTAACADLGRSRARAGIGIAETIDDLAALFTVLADGSGAGIDHESGGHRGGRPGGLAGRPDREPGGEPPLHLICSVAEGWAEEGMVQLAQGGCEDPLSGLATLSYLRTRLAEVYREAEQGGASPADTHRLLVVRLPRRPDPWHRMTLAILVGHDLRTVFPGGETLSIAQRAGAGPAIALVPARRDLPLRYARLRRSVQASFGTQIRMTPLPGRLTEALCLLDELAADPAGAGVPV